MATVERAHQAIQAGERSACNNGTRCHAAQRAPRRMLAPECPAFLEGVDDVARPAQLLGEGAGEQDREQRRSHQQGDLRGRERSVREAHHPISDHLGRRHQQDERYIPDLVSDALIVERSPQQPEDPGGAVRSAHENQGREERARRRERTHREARQQPELGHCAEEPEGGGEAD